MTGEVVQQRDVEFQMAYAILAMALVGSTCGGNIPFIPTWLGGLGGAGIFAFGTTLPTARGDLCRVMGMRVVALAKEFWSIQTDLQLWPKLGIVGSKLLDKILILDRQHGIKDRIVALVMWIYSQIQQVSSQIQQQQQQQQQQRGRGGGESGGDGRDDRSPPRGRRRRGDLEDDFPPSQRGPIRQDGGDWDPQSERRRQPRGQMDDRRRGGRETMFPPNGRSRSTDMAGRDWKGPQGRSPARRDEDDPYYREEWNESNDPMPPFDEDRVEPPKKGRFWK